MQKYMYKIYAYIPAFPKTHTKAMTKNIVLTQNWEKSEFRETLSENQLQAFDLIHKWCLNYSEARVPFVLKGYAGTGKTYCIQRVIKSLQQCFQWDSGYSMKPIKVAMCAPTHKARNVLEIASVNAGLSVHIATLHSLCHLMPGDYDENGKQGMKINPYSSEPHYQDFDLVVVDESSMIGEEALLFMPYMQTPTIFMGDPAQLPPVSDNDEQQESPIFSMPSIDIELTQVQRYSGAIADYVFQLRSDINAERIPHLENGNNLTKYNTETWLQYCLDSFRLRKSTTKALCWTNKRVAALNESIRGYILADADEFEVGEQLFCKEPIIKVNLYGQRAIAAHTCADLEVVEVVIDKKRDGLVGTGFKIWKLDVETDTGKEIEVSCIHEDSWKLIDSALQLEKKRILGLSDRTDKKEAWKAYYEFLEDYNLIAKSKLMHRLQYAYALNIHQSQGSTYPHAFVDSSNILGCQNPVMRNKLLYTGYTRASQHLYVCSKV